MKQEIMLTGKVALITGGGTGLGLAIAREMAEMGAEVVLAGRRLEVLEKARAELGEHAHAIQADITEFDKLPGLVERIEREIGPLDILVNNAGIQVRRPMDEFVPEDFLSLYKTHGVAAFMLTQAAARGMKARGRGSIIFISSLSTVIGMTMLQPYTMAKSAVAGLVRSLANELSPYGVRVNSLNPGFVDTDMLRYSNSIEPGREQKILSRTPMGRMAQPKEIGMAAAFLASDAASFVTGIDLRVDGGLPSVF